MNGVKDLETPVSRIIQTKGAGTEPEVVSEVSEVVETTEAETPLGVATSVVVARTVVAMNRCECKSLVKRSAGLEALIFREAIGGKSTIGWMIMGN